jgi:23S rRNA (pseudouridine1915-N3)-methyltransferase
VRFLLLAVGKPRDRALAAAIAEYEARAARYWPLEAHEVREESARGATPDAVRAKEGERLLSRAGTARLVVADVEGRAMGSEALSRWMREAQEAARDVAFVIGGAYGLPPTVRDRAELRLSFSAFTLPHELARLVLAEQLYRAGTILRGEPYHK